MALQTLTGTATGPPSTATGGAATKGTGNGTNSGFGSATPLIPAFLLAGILTFGIFALMCFRRHRAGPFAARGDSGAAIGGGPLGAGFYLGRGLGAARMSNAYGVHGLAATRRREEREEVKLGDKPKMWDVLLDPNRHALEDTKDGEEVVRWSALQPLSASFVAKPPIPVKAPQPHPLRGQWVFNWGLPAGHPSSRHPNSPESPPVNSGHGDGDGRRLRVSVLISMPQPGQHDRDQEEDVEDLNIALGIAEAPYSERAGRNLLREFV